MAWPFSVGTESFSSSSISSQSQSHPQGFSFSPQTSSFLFSSSSSPSPTFSSAASSSPPPSFGSAPSRPLLGSITSSSPASVLSFGTASSSPSLFRSSNPSSSSSSAAVLSFRTPSSSPTIFRSSNPRSSSSSAPFAFHFTFTASSSSSSTAPASPSLGFGSGSSSQFPSFSINSSSSCSLFGSASASVFGSSSSTASSSTPPSSDTIPNFASASATPIFVFSSSSFSSFSAAPAPLSSTSSSMFGASTSSTTPAAAAATTSSSQLMSSLPHPEFNLQDYADFRVIDDLSVEDVAAVMAALFEDPEITGSSSSIQVHNSVAPNPESATRSQVLPSDATIEERESAAQGSEPPPAPEEAYCAICMDTKPLTELFNTNFCTHMYCTACVCSYVTDKVQDGVGWINCAGPGCEAGFLDLEACRPVLPKNVIDRWGDLLCESTIRVKFYCPHKDCSALLMGDADEDIDGARGEMITQSVCPHCHRMFCAQCRSPWHQGLKCEEVQEMGEGDRGRDDLKLKEVAGSSHWRRCPECNYFVAKDGGCNHITCRCKYEFCYLCGAKWKSTHYACTGPK